MVNRTQLAPCQPCSDASCRRFWLHGMDQCDTHDKANSSNQMMERGNHVDGSLDVAAECSRGCEPTCLATGYLIQAL